MGPAAFLGNWDPHINLFKVNNYVIYCSEIYYLNWFCILNNLFCENPSVADVIFSVSRATWECYLLWIGGTNMWPDICTHWCIFLHWIVHRDDGYTGLILVQNPSKLYIKQEFLEFKMNWIFRMNQIESFEFRKHLAAFWLSTFLILQIACSRHELSNFF